jgi:hypothetical protein
MQQPLEHTMSSYMAHSSTFPDIDARPTTAHVCRGMGALATLTKGVIVDLLAMILAWKPRLAMLLGKVVTGLWPGFRRA